MSALQFLNKKSWHTSTIKNNEKVWIREQEAAKEKARIEELQKQINEERRQEDLQRLEEESGRVDEGAKLKRRRLNWMYEFNDKAEKEKESEDIMLGKKKMDLTEKANVEERDERAILVDEQTKLREDPMAMARAKTPISPVVSAGVNKKDSKKRQDKLMRKQQRENLRQEKRLKRERRSQLKRQLELQQKQQLEQQQLEMQQKQERDDSSCRSKDASSHYSSGVRAKSSYKDDHDDQLSDSVQHHRPNQNKFNQRIYSRSQSRSRSPPRSRSPIRRRTKDNDSSSDSRTKRGVKRRNRDGNNIERDERVRFRRNHRRGERARLTDQRERELVRSRYRREYYSSDDDSHSHRSHGSDDRYYNRSRKRSKATKQRYSSYSSTSSSSSSSSYDSCRPAERETRYKGDEIRTKHYAASRK